MTLPNNAALLIARILLGVVFLISGLGKIGDVPGFTGYLITGGLPAFLAWPAVLFEIVAGAMLIAGIFTRPVALALIGFTLLAGLLYHFVPADQLQMIMFFKNIGISGGLLALFVTGPGTISVDAKRGTAPAYA